MLNEELKEAVRLLVFACHKESFDANWWKDKNGNPIQNNPYAFSNKIALIHSELSEALEADRKDLMDSHLPHLLGTECELADAMIRLCDLAGAYNLDLGRALVEKMEYNKNRADHKKEARDSVNGKKY